MSNFLKNTVVEVFEGSSVTFECPIINDLSMNSLKITWLQSSLPIDVFLYILKLY